MTFRQDEFNLLISDKRTVISFTNNHTGDGERIITMDAIIRPHSFLLNEKKTGIINPHRAMSNIPVEYVRVCPRCHDDWFPVQQQYKTGGVDYTTYTCANKCGVSVCADTFNRFSPRGVKLDIPSTTGETMARATEAFTIDIGDITIDVGDITVDLSGIDFAQDKPTIVNTDVLDIGDITIHHSPMDTKQKEA